MGGCTVIFSSIGGCYSEGSSWREEMDFPLTGVRVPMKACWWDNIVPEFLGRTCIVYCHIVR